MIINVTTKDRPVLKGEVSETLHLLQNLSPGEERLQIVLKLHNLVHGDTSEKK